MINLPPQLTPSELLCYYEELPPFIDELLRGSRSRRREGELSEAERCALDVMEASQGPGTNASQAVALIHLADVHYEMGKLGPALADCQKAHRILQRQRSRCQRHNLAVAAYALGLVHQLLGGEMEALKWYRESGQLFERVKEDWATVNDLGRVEACTRVQRWVETLSEYLTAVRARADANFSTRIWVPIIPSGVEGGGFAIAELGIDQYRLERELTVNGESFRVQPLKGKRRISLSAGVEYYAVEIPDAACESLGAGVGDYALVVRGQDADKEGPGVLETLSGPEFGNFERDGEGNINFTRPNAALIGGRDIGEELHVGYITALLRPTSSPSEPSAHPPSEPSTPRPPEPSTPPPRPPADSVNLYRELIRMVGGDKETADRLIEYERERTPDASLPGLVDSAIVRLTRDRQ